MVNAYMYQAGAGSGQAVQQGPTVPTTTPAYSSYQPASTQGYQASEGWDFLQGSGIWQWDLREGGWVS